MAVSQLAEERCCSTQEQEEDIGGKVVAILASYKGEKNELIPMLQQVQQVFGYLPAHAMQQIARFTGMPESTVYGVATFYAQFRLVPTGRNVIRVCRGTACHVKGGARVLRAVEKRLGIKPGESTADLEYALETVACIGACALAPTMVVNNNTHGQMTPRKATEILDRGPQEG